MIFIKLFLVLYGIVTVTFGQSENNNVDNGSTSLLNNGIRSGGSGEKRNETDKPHEPSSELVDVNNDNLSHIKPRSLAEANPIRSSAPTANTNTNNNPGHAENQNDVYLDTLSGHSNWSPYLGLDEDPDESEESNFLRYPLGPWTYAYDLATQSFDNRFSAYEPPAPYEDQMPSFDMQPIAERRRRPPRRNQRSNGRLRQSFRNQRAPSRRPSGRPRYGNLIPPPIDDGDFVSPVHPVPEWLPGLYTGLPYEEPPAYIPYGLYNPYLR